MKKMFPVASLVASLLLISLAPAAQAGAAARAGRCVTEVACGETRGLLSGYSLLIKSSCFAGATLAFLSFRDDLGNIENFGSILVNRKSPLPDPRSGRITYVGKDFELHIETDGSQPNTGFNSHLYADAKGRAFNQPMICNFPAHTQ